MGRMVSETFQGVLDVFQSGPRRFKAFQEASADFRGVLGGFGGLHRLSDELGRVSKRFLMPFKAFQCFLSCFSELHKDLRLHNIQVSFGVLGGFTGNEALEVYQGIHRRYKQFQRHSQEFRGVFEGLQNIPRRFLSFLGVQKLSGELQGIS